MVEGPCGPSPRCDLHSSWITATCSTGSPKIARGWELLTFELNEGRTACVLQGWHAFRVAAACNRSQVIFEVYKS